MNPFSSTDKEDISIVLCGAAGQGIKTVEQLLTYVFKRAGFNIVATKEYMSRVRGGTNSTELRVSSKRVAAFVDRIDVFIPLNDTAIARQKKRLSNDTVIIGEKENITNIEDDFCTIIDLPFSQFAKELGSAIYSNIIASGVIAALFNIDQSLIKDYLKGRFESKGKEVLMNNYKALEKGFELAKELKKEKGLSISLKPNDSVQDELIYNGAQAVGMGAIAGGCNFICSYPMSPSTGVLVFLAQHSHEFDILVEQAEDEIAAINAGLGAAYAGARAMITTSGGGFALMGEGVSLAGIIETPIVMHIAQRPGPATGLPTRTEQGDLELVLYSGHGDFPRVILAPGTLEQAITLTQQAFNMAEEYQTPVIILTDQFFMDLFYNFPKFKLKETIQSHIVKTSKSYQRYKLTKNGISPRGIPGHGAGIVRADSDEHDEDGFITEDLDEMRPKMVAKRMNKLEYIRKKALMPKLVGPKDYETLIVAWGSTFTALNEALQRINNKKVALLHFGQLYPLNPKVKDLLAKAKDLVLVENNVTGQFGKLLKLTFSVSFKEKLLKFNGMPFSVEELESKIKAILEG